MSLKQLAEPLWNAASGRSLAMDIAFLVIVSTLCYLAIVGREIPQGLLTPALIAFGFYFGKGVSGNGSQNNTGQ